MIWGLILCFTIMCHNIQNTKDSMPMEVNARCLRICQKCGYCKYMELLWNCLRQFAAIYLFIVLYFIPCLCFCKSFTCIPEGFI